MTEEERQVEIDRMNAETAKERASEATIDNWFGKHCIDQCCQWEENEETGGPNYMEAHPSLIFCNNKANTEDTEGNCTSLLCPLEAESVKDQDMFATDDSTAIIQIGEMAENLAVSMGEEEALYKAHSSMKAANEAAKEQLNRALTEAGMESCKLECGLTPQTRVNERVFKATGVDDEMLFEWLREPRVNVALAIKKLEKSEVFNHPDYPVYKEAVAFLSKFSSSMITTHVFDEKFPKLALEVAFISGDLGDIIKETVHHTTLSSAMKEHRDQGNELPESVFQVSLRPTITMGGKAKYLASKE